MLRSSGKSCGLSCHALPYCSYPDRHACESKCYLGVNVITSSTSAKGSLREICTFPIPTLLLYNLCVNVSVDTRAPYSHCNTVTLRELYIDHYCTRNCCKPFAIVHVYMIYQWHLLHTLAPILEHPGCCDSTCTCMALQPFVMHVYKSPRLSSLFCESLVRGVADFIQPCQSQWCDAVHVYRICNVQIESN